MITNLLLALGLLTSLEARVACVTDGGGVCVDSSPRGNALLQKSLRSNRSVSVDGGTVEVHDMLSVESQKMTENIEGVPGYDEKKKQNCPGNNLDMHEHEAQCFKNPDSNGGSNSYGADSNALCLNKDQCAKLCSETATCEVVEMHRTKQRCYLNTGACVKEAAQSSNSNYDLLFRASHYWEIFYKIDSFRSTGCGNDAGGAAEQVWYGSIGGCDTGCKIKDPAYEDVDKVNTIQFSTGLCRKTFHVYDKARVATPYTVKVGIKAFEADRTYGDKCKKGKHDDCAVDYTENVGLTTTNGQMAGKDVCSGKHCVRIEYSATYITAERPKEGSPVVSDVYGIWTITRGHKLYGNRTGTKVDEVCGKSTDTFTIGHRPSKYCKKNNLGDGQVAVNQDGVSTTWAWFCSTQGETEILGAPTFAAQGPDGACANEHQDIENAASLLSEESNVDTAQESSADLSCSCSTPNAGAAGHNQFTCTDGTTSFCGATEACYADAPFLKEKEADACGVTCSCSTPNAGAAGHNQFTCTDGTTNHCGETEACYAHASFLKQQVADGCGKPTVYESKAGRGGCDEAELQYHSGGFTSEASVQEKCSELSCAYYTWSDDQSKIVARAKAITVSHETRGAAWFCSKDSYQVIDNSADWPLWKVGRPIEGHTEARDVYGIWTITRGHKLYGMRTGTKVDEVCGKSTDTFTIGHRPSKFCKRNNLGDGQVALNQDGAGKTWAWFCSTQGETEILGAPTFATEGPDGACANEHQDIGNVA